MTARYARATYVKSIAFFAVPKAANIRFVCIVNGMGSLHLYKPATDGHVQRIGIKKLVLAVQLTLELFRRHIECPSI